MKRLRRSRLGILGTATRLGHDLKMLTDLSTRHFWSGNHGNLYPTLKRLEQNGPATSPA